MKNDLFLNKTESRSFEIYLRRYGVDYLFILFSIHMFQHTIFCNLSHMGKAPLNDRADAFSFSSEPSSTYVLCVCDGRRF